MGRGKHESLLPNRLRWLRWGLRVSLVDRLRRQSRRPGGQIAGGDVFALGYGGQFAFVIPAYDLVVVHRHDEEHGPNLRQMGRLLWLVLDAGHFPDIGPDATIAAAKGKPLDGGALKQLVTGKTLRYGDGAASGP